VSDLADLGLVRTAAHRACRRGSVRRPPRAAA
jgi:hypothetical protein